MTYIAQGTVTAVRDKASEEGGVVACASIVLSDFHAERLELPWATVQDWLITLPGALTVTVQYTRNKYIQCSAE